MCQPRRAGRIHGCLRPRTSDHWVCRTYTDCLVDRSYRARSRPVLDASRGIGPCRRGPTALLLTGAKAVGAKLMVRRQVTKASLRNTPCALLLSRRSASTQLRVGQYLSADHLEDWERPFVSRVQWTLSAPKRSGRQPNSACPSTGRYPPLRTADATLPTR